MENLIEGYKFREPADKTSRFIDTMTTEITNFKVKMEGMEKDIGYIAKSIETNKVENDLQHAELKKGIEEIKAALNASATVATTRYADKSVEKVFWVVVKIVIGILVAALLGLIIKSAI